MKDRNNSFISWKNLFFTWVIFFSGINRQQPSVPLHFHQVPSCPFSVHCDWPHCHRFLQQYPLCSRSLCLQSVAAYREFRFWAIGWFPRATPSKCAIFGLLVARDAKYNILIWTRRKSSGKLLQSILKAFYFNVDNQCMPGLICVDVIKGKSDVVTLLVFEFFFSKKSIPTPVGVEVFI